MSAPAGEASGAERLARWERRANPFIVVAAIVPIVVAFTRDPTEGITRSSTSPRGWCSPWISRSTCV
jgi:hypothetical protein